MSTAKLAVGKAGAQSSFSFELKAHKLNFLRFPNFAALRFYFCKMAEGEANRGDERAGKISQRPIAAGQRTIGWLVFSTDGRVDLPA